MNSEGEVVRNVQQIVMHMNFRTVLEEVLLDETLLWVRVRELGVDRDAWLQRVNVFLANPDAFKSEFRIEMNIQRYAEAEGFPLKLPVFNTHEPVVSETIYERSLGVVNEIRYGNPIADGAVDGDPDNTNANVEERNIRAVQLAAEGRSGAFFESDPETQIEIAEAVCLTAEVTIGNPLEFEIRLRSFRQSSSFLFNSITEPEFLDWANNSLQFFCPEIAASFLGQAIGGGDEPDEDPSLNAVSPARFQTALDSTQAVTSFDPSISNNPLPDRIELILATGVTNSPWGRGLLDRQILELGEIGCASIAENAANPVQLNQTLLNEHQTNWEEAPFGSWLDVVATSASVSCPLTIWNYVSAE